MFSSHRIIIWVYNFSSKLLGDEEAAQGEELVKSNSFNIRQGCVGAGCSTRWGCQLAEDLPCTSRAEALLLIFYRMGFHSLTKNICVCCAPIPILNAHLGLACTHTHTLVYRGSFVLGALACPTHAAPQHTLCPSTELFLSWGQTKLS